ncbi:MAG: hypothetical protein BIFFINMI_02770 [Phycisphaerae bacterium]|nr:hypothetical protein [Phycisphaerae bacterium]
MSRPTQTLARNVGELKASGYRPRSVKDELRENLIARLKGGQPLFPGIVGYDQTVIPQIVNAILSRHDLLFLGLRGQAKTRMLRALPGLLDERTPVLADVEIPDDPLAPRLKQSAALLGQQGDAARVEWLPREARYHEKLATPDVTIADLIGEIDLVKVAQGRRLADESTMHFGLIPRTNRGIFAINELPDLAPRIQVGLFNVLEERDVQIRGYPVRLPLDVTLVFSANPEDYTNRGRIVTPLKDRIGSVIRTHYPHSEQESMAITRANAWCSRTTGPVTVPRFMHEIIEELVRIARASPHINQASGVSVRASIANFETLVSSAERRAILLGETRIVPRVTDLAFLAASCRGKIELMLADDEQAEDKLIAAMLGEAVQNVFARYADFHKLEGIVAQFQGQVRLHSGDEVSNAELLANARHVEGLAETAEQLCRATGGDPADEAQVASAVEFVLEALHVNNRLSKHVRNNRTYYRQ